MEPSRRDADETKLGGSDAGAGDVDKAEVRGKPARKRTTRAHPGERERRVDQVCRWIGQCRPTAEIIREAMEQWGHERRSAYRYLRRAYDRLAAATEKNLAQQRNEADQCYRALIEWAFGHLEHTLENTTIIEEPGPDGRPVRKVKVTRRRVMPAHAPRTALWARARMDKIAGLEKVKPVEPPVGIDIRWPVWCGHDAPAPGPGWVAAADGSAPAGEEASALPMGEGDGGRSAE